MIDADKFRVLFPGYVGNNSDEFQRGSSLLVDATLDLVLKKGYSFILDATFATSKVKQNIERALKKLQCACLLCLSRSIYCLGFCEKWLKGVLFLKSVLSMLFPITKNLMRVKEQISRSSDNQYLSEGLSKYDF